MAVLHVYMYAYMYVCMYVEARGYMGESMGAIGLDVVISAIMRLVSRGEVLWLCFMCICMHVCMYVCEGEAIWVRAWELLVLMW